MRSDFKRVLTFLPAATLLSAGLAQGAQTAETGAASPSPASVSAAVAAPAALPAAPVDPAIDLFARKCSSCHTVGQGNRVGPDLKGVHDRRPRAWLESFIKTPSGMLDSDPEARALLTRFGGVRMPDLGLSAADSTTLVDLIARCSGQPCDLTPALVPVTSATAADIARGRELFTGRQPLQAGGAPCLSCHTARGAGTWVGGGRLAKDLTNAFARLGDQGLDAGLRNPAFPVMNKVFAAHPLQPDEAFALRAFLYDSNRASSGTAETTYGPLLAAVLGAIVAMAALDLAWSRRLRGVRFPMTHRKKEQG